MPEVRSGINERYGLFSSTVFRVARHSSSSQQTSIS
jgi:hypothetical protein